ncbi:dual specificity protein phosphatase Pps1p [Monosporozyma unispora]
MEPAMRHYNKRPYTTMDRSSSNNSNEDNNHHGVTPQETATWLKIHQSMQLPNHEVVFPWLHTYSLSSPPAYPDAISIIRSIPIQTICKSSQHDPIYLDDTGLLKNSMDPCDFLITWADQIKYESLKYNYDPTSNDIKQILHEIFTTEITKFSIPMDSIQHLEQLIKLCMLHKVLPFLKTDPYAWNKYCMKSNVRSNSNGNRISNHHSSTTTKNFQASNFRRFDLQPSKMIELSSKLIFYCLNTKDGKAHDLSCPYCQELSQLLTLALKFIKFSYQILDGKVNNINSKNYQSCRQETFVLEYESLNDFPIEIVGTPSLLTTSKDIKLSQNEPIPLASKYNIVTFNNWNTNLQYHEKLEMNRMSSATLIDDDDKLWCGNLIDYQILTNKLKQKNNQHQSDTKHEPYYSPLNSTIKIPFLQYDPEHPNSNDKFLFNTTSMNPSLNTKLIVRCSDQSNLPNIDTLWSKFRKFFVQEIPLSDLPVQIGDYMSFNFSCSGSIGLGNLNISSIETILNVCFLIWQVSKFTPYEVLMYCTDGYTETTFLAVAYSIFLWDLPLQDVIYKLHLDKDRPFFLFQVDLQVLGHLQTLLRSFSPNRASNWTEKFMLANTHTIPKLPLTPLKIDHEMFSSIFLMKLPELNDFIKLNGPLPSRILPHIYLGSLVHAHSPGLLHSLGITHIVSVGENLSWVSASVDNNTANKNIKKSKVNDPRINHISGSTRSRGIPSPPKVSKILQNMNDTNNLRNRGMTINDTNTINTDSHIINDTSNLMDPDLFSIIEQDGFKICKINNLEDNGKDPLTGRGQLNAVLEFIDQCERSGGKVLVHCMVGVSRSATVCIAECMKRLKIDLLRAYLYVRVRRLNIIIQPNLMFMYELLKWQESLVGVPRTIDWHIICKAIAELNRKYMN